ncbi:MAG TPA: GNAT family N-acetyltransferase [Chloroflexota bacterium]|jgi:ribosomal protein S18 acetylase RimI-like enzyme|nr:GNAT family N-acetyltransferase [Chloroflexota bacterium]
MSAPTVRLFAPDDVQAVMRMAGAEGWPSLADSAEHTCALLASAGSVALVAEVEGEVVGLAFGYGVGHVEGYLSELVVEAGHRRQGIARALIEELFVHLDVERLELLSTPEGEPFYRSFPHQRWPGYRLYRQRPIELEPAWLHGSNDAS